jgi:hypothetical protein
MKKTLLFLMLFASIISYEAMGQCGRISLIGEFNGWAADYFMTRNPENPDLFTVILTVTASDDTDTSGFVDMKFRENADWTNNWGGVGFPAGTGLPGGTNIAVPPGSYLVTFNCNTLAYNFQSTCGNIGLVGEFNGWGNDLFMTRDMASPDNFTVILTVTASDDVDLNGTVELKFRADADWTFNWGAVDFPSGIGLPGGSNIPVPPGSYLVTFNCTTGAYNFQATCGEIGIIGEFTNWSSDLFMTRDMASPDNFSVILSVKASDDLDTNGTVEVKFRANSDWGTNWGAADFPSGIGLPGGVNIPVALDGTGATSDYLVTFNCSTGAYNFQSTSGPITLIGEFNGWAGDVPMNRDASNPDLWTLIQGLPAVFDYSPADGKVDVKFRENKDWTTNWGNNTFPTGNGVDNGPNIPATPGEYNISFNYSTKAYDFTPNTEACGEIGLIGDFNTWGDNGSGLPTDIWMVRDPVYPSNFTANYNFTSSTNLWFRVDGDVTYTDVYGGTFPEGTATVGGAYIQVPGGKYDITFNCKSGDFKFTRLGNGVSAPKVFAITVDGVLDEPDWKITQPISNVVLGAPTPMGLSSAKFGVAYTDSLLYVGIDILDSSLTLFRTADLFIDGNKSGGAYDSTDLWIRFTALGNVIVMYPPDPDTIYGIDLAFMPHPDFMGANAELSIPWNQIHVTPVTGGQVGFDVILGVADSATSIGVDYMVAWNGGLQDTNNTSSFGDLLFGSLSCGCISLYNNNIGDVVLQNPAGSTTNYVGSYELFSAQDMMFRKDTNSSVSWGADAFPGGTATVGGPAIPGVVGRYRIAFDCITGTYTFTDNPAGAQVAYSEYTDTPPAMDGDLGEYTLSYGSTILVEGVDNNTVSWGSRWDMNNVYFGVHVVDANVVPVLGNPWDNDAIEYYINGNHSRDGAYNKNFDTQLVQDAYSNSIGGDSALWVKADGVPITNRTAIWKTTSDGYSVELRLGWDNFKFLPGQGRSIGFSLGNDENNGVSATRAGQTVWYGTASNWSNTADLGDLQLKDGPFFFNVGDIVDYSDQIVLFPNPATSTVYLRMVSDIFKGNVTLYVNDITGRTVIHQTYNIESNNMILMDASLFRSGIYFVNIIGQNGERATKKLIIR